jgi:uncharacterized protein YjbI with pentapeptide repeats
MREEGFAREGSVMMHGEETPLDGDSVLDSIARIREGKSAVGADLRNAGLAGADLSGLDLGGADLSGANLCEADLSGINLPQAKLCGANLYAATLTGAELLMADLSGAHLEDCSAEAAGLGGANLAGAHLQGARLHNAALSQARLEDADLCVADLSQARLQAADLRAANLAGANLAGADLSEACISQANFRGCDLRGARFTGLRGYQSADWIGVDVRDSDFRGALGVRRLILDENYLHEFRNQSRSHELIYAIWKLTSDCGRSLGRWAIWTLALVTGFAVMFLGVDLDYGQHAPNLLSSFYFSVVTLTTLGYGDILPASPAAQALVILEVSFGYLTLGGLISIFANKMARRAD